MEIIELKSRLLNSTPTMNSHITQTVEADSELNGGGVILSSVCTTVLARSSLYGG